MTRPADRETATAITGQRREGRVFALTLAGGFVFVALLADWSEAETVAIVASSLSAVSLLAAVLAPGRLGPVMRAWMKLGEVMGHVTTPILMAIVYYAIVTPIGLVKRATAGRHRTTNDSDWHPRLPLPPPERMERQF